MRRSLPHPTAERHELAMLALFAVLAMLLTLLFAKAAGGAPF